MLVEVSEVGVGYEVVAHVGMIHCQVVKVNLVFLERRQLAERSEEIPAAP